MLKKIKDLSDFIKINDQKEGFDKILFNVLEVIKDEAGLILNKDEVIFKGNVLKIKTDSNLRFIILLNLININKKIKTIDSNLIVEL